MSKKRPRQPLTPPPARRHMHPATVRALRLAAPARWLWARTSTIVATIIWLGSAAPVWGVLCAWPLQPTVGIMAGSATGLTAGLAVTFAPTRTPGWRTLAWAWVAAVTAGACTIFATATHMQTWAPWPTVAAVGAAALVILGRTNSSARILIRLARQARWMR